MSNQDDRWLWFIDDAPLQALLKAELEVGTMKMRAASSPALVRAMSSHLEGRISEAIELLDSAIAAGESQPELHLMLGQIHFEARNFELAYSVYSKLIALDAERFTAQFNAAVCCEKLSRWKEAAAHFHAASKLDPNRREAWLGLGLCCLHQRRADDALDAFSRFLEAEPDHESALFGTAVALQMLRRYDEAAAIYERFRGNGEPSAELLTNLLALAVARKDHSAVSRIASELAAARPESRQAAEAKAYTHMLAGQWPQAVLALLGLAEREALPEAWQYALAYALWRSGKTAEAKGQLDILFERSPNHPNGLLLRGALLEEQGQPGDALAAFRSAAYHMPDCEPAHWNLARLAALESKPESCRQAAKSLLDCNRDSAEGWFALGMAGLLEGNVDEAGRAFSEALRLRQDWPEAEWNLGLSLLQNGDAEKAGRLLARSYKSLSRKPSVTPLLWASVSCRNWERALELLESAEADAVPPEVRFNLAVGLHETGRLRDAERVYRSVPPGTQVFEDALINLGHVLLASGRPLDAEAVWKEACEQP